MTNAVLMAFDVAAMIWYLWVNRGEGRLREEVNFVGDLMLNVEQNWFPSSLMEGNRGNGIRGEDIVQ